MSRIRITAVSGQRQNNTNAVSSFTAAGLASRDCHDFRVEIFEPSGFIPLFPAVVVQASGNPIDQNFPESNIENDDVFVALFDVGQAAIPGIQISCGASVRIKVASATPGTIATVDDIFSIACKTRDPDSHHDDPGTDTGDGGRGGHGGNGNNGGIDWPSWFCPFTARAFAYILWATLMAVALAVAATGWIPQPVIAAGITAAGIFLAAWLLACRPSLRAILRIITRVFMAATVAGFLLAVVMTNFTVAVLASLYGGFTAFLITVLRAHGCRVPRLF